MTDNEKNKETNLIPQSREAEQSVLGGLMLDNDLFDVVAEIVIESDFYHRGHRLIFSAMSDLSKQNEPLDVLTVTEKLRLKNELDLIGGIAYLSDIARNTPSVANLKYYAEIIKEKSISREVITVAQSIADKGFNPEGMSSHDLLDYAESKVFNIAEKRIANNEGPSPIHVILERTVDKIEALFEQSQNGGSGLTGISTGFVDLDKKTTGLQPSDLIIVAARPSMGKTTFAMNLCEHAAIEEDKPVLIFSLEMPAEQIMMRMFASLGRVDQTKVRTGNLDDDDWARLSSTMGILLEKGKMLIDDGSGLSPTDLRSRARRVAKEHGGLSMIMIDYLQLMQVPGLPANANRTLEIAEISRSLKALAKELECPVVALSQLNRGLEQRADKRPINSDLRESGSIEQDADLILFIYRDEVYNPETAEKGLAEIIIGKQRNGPIGKINLTFQGQYSRFDNYVGNDFEYE